MNKKANWFAEVDAAELSCRILEGITNTMRPEGKTPREALMLLPQEDANGLLRASKNACDYLVECIEKGQRSN